MGGIVSGQKIVDGLKESVPASWRGDDRRSTALSGAPLATHELRHRR
jgi:hypothetical protein